MPSPFPLPFPFSLAPFFSLSHSSNLPFPLSRYTTCDLPQPFCLSLKGEVEQEANSGRGRGEGEGRGE